MHKDPPVIDHAAAEAALASYLYDGFTVVVDVSENYSRLAEHPEFLDQSDYIASMSAAERQNLKATARAAWQVRSWTWWMKLMTPICEENIRKIVAAGDVAALGADQSSGPAAYRELELLVQAGLTPAQVIRIATHNGAVFLGRPTTWARSRKASWPTWCC